MAGIDTSIYGGLKPVDIGDPMEARKNALAMQSIQMQQQKMQFDLQKAQEDREYQQGQRAQAAAAYAKDQAAEKDANNAFLKTAQPGYTVNPNLSVPGAASDVGSVGSEMYPDLQGQRVAPTAPDMNATVNALINQGKFDAARKIMAQNQAVNTNTESNLKTQQQAATTSGATTDAAAKAMAFHASQLPAVTQQTYSAWRDQTIKDLPGLDKILPPDAPVDPSQFEELKRSLILKAQDGVTKHYQTITNGNQTQTVGIDPITQQATAVPGTEGENPDKTKQSTLATAQSERQALVDQLSKNPTNTTLQAQIKQYDDLINKETKAPSDIPKLNPGEQWNPQANRADAIPGSKLYVEQTIKHEKDQKAASGVVQKTDAVSNLIDDILSDKNKGGLEGNFGGVGAYATRMLPGGENARVGAKIETLKSNMKSAGLEMMRSGGGIGAMTEREWPIVEGMIGNLSPSMSVKDARDALGSIKARMQNLADNAKETYNGTWGNTQYHKPDAGTVRQGGQAGAAAPAANPYAGKTDEQIKKELGL